MFKRTLALPTPGSESFFLWGARQSGKTTLLKETYPNALWFDLLQSELFRQLLERPEALREIILAQRTLPPIVVIDEVQKVPGILDEVHGLIESHDVHFALSGSSARKIKRGQANLLGGRAVRYELFGLVSGEVGQNFSLERFVNRGCLPRHYLSEHHFRLLNAYVSDYLKEEIASEGIVRNLPAFSHFLDVAAIGDTELVNFSNIARECGVSSHTVREYFQILVDTLIGNWLFSYTKQPKRRVLSTPKFYFRDVGVVNFLTKRKALEPGSSLFGKAFENWIFHELSAYNAYSEAFATFSYWRLTTGVEVDFVVNDMALAIEVKASPNIASQHLKNLRELKKDHPELKQSVLVALEKRPRKTEDGILILPVAEFTQRLWEGQLF